MYNEKELERLKKQLARVQKCKGNCHDCKRLLIETASTDRALYMAFGCGIAPNFSPISNTLKGLKAALIDQLQFEIA